MDIHIHCYLPIDYIELFTRYFYILQIGRMKKIHHKKRRTVKRRIYTRNRKRIRQTGGGRAEYIISCHADNYDTHTLEPPASRKTTDQENRELVVYTDYLVDGGLPIKDSFILEKYLVTKDPKVLNLFKDPKPHKIDPLSVTPVRSTYNARLYVKEGDTEISSPEILKTIGYPKTLWTPGIIDITTVGAPIFVEKPWTFATHSYDRNYRLQDALNLIDAHFMGTHFNPASYLTSYVVHMLTCT